MKRDRASEDEERWQRRAGRKRKRVLNGNMRFKVLSIDRYGEISALRLHNPEKRKRERKRARETTEPQHRCFV